MKKKIYIDFDGVINNYSGWKDGELFEPKEGALVFIEKSVLNMKYGFLRLVTEKSFGNGLFDIILINT